MKKVAQQYRRNITEVYKIITMLDEKDREKIPVRVQEFFRENSLGHLLDSMEMNEDIVENKLSLTTKKLLKIIEMYINR